VITLDLRDAIARASGSTADPKLRPGGPPGAYATSLAFLQAHAYQTGPIPVAQRLATSLAAQDWVAGAVVTGGGYVTITVTPQALAGVAARVTAAGPGCVTSDLLRDVTVAEPPPADVVAAATWEDARKSVAAELTARLAVAAGATLAPDPGGQPPGARRAGPGQVPGGPARRTGDAGGPGREGCAGREESGDPAAASAYAGADAVRFALARAIPGKPVRVDAASVARNSLDNPAYAVRYAHARAVSGVRWAAALSATGEAALPCLPADPAGLALLDALSWLPERVATAARRGRPDEFARYLEDLASATIAAVPHLAPGDDERLAMARALADAARTGLAAGLGLLGVSPPDRL
jgi:arginyl-tRNA synthetase